MEIIVAKSAGFCYGVKLAVDKTKEALANYDNVYTTNLIVHNEHINKKLEEQGLRFVNSINEIPDESTIIIRAHGVSKEEITECERKKLHIVDTTCKNVKKIHEIVQEYSEKGYKILIIGDKEHGEVKGIIGWTLGSFEVISSTDDIKEYEKVCVVSQTTVNISLWEVLIEKIKKSSKECIVFNTICGATYARQEEAKKIAQNVSTFIVIGDKKSANSNRLYEIASEHCENTYFIQTAKDLLKEDIKGEKIGITAGASTPDYIIDEVVNKIKNTTK